MKRFKVFRKKLFLAGAVFTVIVLAGLYIFQNNFEIASRYLIDEYTGKIKELSQENKILEIESAQISSLEKISQQISLLNFEKNNKIYYLKVLNTQAIAK